MPKDKQPCAVSREGSGVIKPKIEDAKRYHAKKAGRPAEMNEGKRVNVYLDTSSLTKAAELGCGNVSEGIRIALAKATN